MVATTPDLGVWEGQPEVSTSWRGRTPHLVEPAGAQALVTTSGVCDHRAVDCPAVQDDGPCSAHRADAEVGVAQFRVCGQRRWPARRWIAAALDSGASHITESERSSTRRTQLDPPQQPHSPLKAEAPPNPVRFSSLLFSSALRPSSGSCRRGRLHALRTTDACCRHGLLRPPAEGLLAACSHRHRFP